MTEIGHNSNDEIKACRSTSHHPARYPVVLVGNSPDSRREAAGGRRPVGRAGGANRCRFSHRAAIDLSAMARATASGDEAARFM